MFMGVIGYSFLSLCSLYICNYPFQPSLKLSNIVIFLLPYLKLLEEGSGSRFVRNVSSVRSRETIKIISFLPIMSGKYVRYIVLFPPVSRDLFGVCLCEVATDLHLSLSFVWVTLGGLQLYTYRFL